MTASDVRLTRRERELLAEIVDGRSNKAMALKFRVSEQTVRNQLTVLFQKFGVSTRLALAMYAVRNDLMKKPRE